MAFVTRSPRQPPFSPPKQSEGSQKESLILKSSQKTIHEGVQKKLNGCKNRKNSDHKNQYSELTQNTDTGQLSLIIGKNQDIEESQKKNKYNLQNLKKRKFQALITKPTDYIQVDPQEYYSLPKCFSQKSMVRYVSKSSTELKKADKQRMSMPGPGAYDVKLPPCSKVPIFHNRSSYQGVYSQPKYENERCIVEEKNNNKNSHYVDYQKMNSSSFKKSLNLLASSNKNLMSKILGKSVSQTQTTYRMPENDEDYVKVQDYGPEPCTYTPVKKSTNKASLFPNEKRFQISLSDGSNQFYDVSPRQNKNKNKNQRFVSMVERFQKKQQSDNKPLQYCSYEKSFITKSKNRFQIGFDSTSPRKDKEQEIDPRPFYSPKKIAPKVLVTKIVDDHKQRSLFSQPDPIPGPGEYAVGQVWTKSPSYKFNQEKKKLMEVPTKQKQNSMTIEKIPTKKKNSLKRLPLTNKYQVHKIQEEGSNGYYDTAPKWENKSFNVLFSSEIIHANNPTKNKNT